MPIEQGIWEEKILRLSQGEGTRELGFKRELRVEGISSC